MSRGLLASVVSMVALGIALGGQTRTPGSSAQPAAFSVVEATIPQMRDAMASGRLTSQQLVTQYITRLGLYENRLHAATLATDLHNAGAIIIAKTGLTELANWVAGNPTAMPGNYNAVGGFGYNPYDPRPDPREATFDGRPALQTGGSSSGIGTAANLWAANVGTDTGGSVISPSNANMLVGIRPTIGRISRYGVIPITADHDTAGPMARSVTDAAIMMGALESPAPDPNDPETKACTPPPGRDYTKFLRADALKGARIGIPRAFYYDRVVIPGDDADPSAGSGRGRGGRGGAA